MISNSANRFFTAWSESGDIEFMFIVNSVRSAADSCLGPGLAASLLAVCPCLVKVKGAAEKVKEVQEAVNNVREQVQKAVDDSAAGQLYSDCAQLHDIAMKFQGEVQEAKEICAGKRDGEEVEEEEGAGEGEKIAEDGPSLFEAGMEKAEEWGSDVAVPATVQECNKIRVGQPKSEKTEIEEISPDFPLGTSELLITGTNITPDPTITIYVSALPSSALERGTEEPGGGSGSQKDEAQKENALLKAKIQRFESSIKVQESVSLTQFDAMLKENARLQEKIQNLENSLVTGIHSGGRQRESYTGNIIQYLRKTGLLSNASTNAQLGFIDGGERGGDGCGDGGVTGGNGGGGAAARPNLLDRHPSIRELESRHLVQLKELHARVEKS